MVKRKVKKITELRFKGPPPPVCITASPHWVGRIFHSAVAAGTSALAHAHIMAESNLGAPPSSWSASRLSSWLEKGNKLDAEVNYTTAAAAAASCCVVRFVLQPSSLVAMSR